MYPVGHPVVREVFGQEKYRLGSGSVARHDTAKQPPGFRAGFESSILVTSLAGPDPSGAAPESARRPLIPIPETIGAMGRAALLRRRV